MGSPLRPAAADAVSHVLDRANVRRTLFEDDGDYGTIGDRTRIFFSDDMHSVRWGGWEVWRANVGSVNAMILQEDILLSRASSCRGRFGLDVFPF